MKYIFYRWPFSASVERQYKCMSHDIITTVFGGRSRSGYIEPFKTKHMLSISSDTLRNHNFRNFPSASEIRKFYVRPKTTEFWCFGQ